MSSRLLIFLNTLIEKFQCCYRDGLDGTKDMRSFLGIYFLLRIILYVFGLLSKIIFNINGSFGNGFVFSLTALLIALCQPYKKTHMNIVDSILLFYMATLCYTREALQKTPAGWSHLFLSLMQTIILLPFLVIFLLTTYRLVCGIFQHLQGSLLSSRCLTCLKSTRAKFCGSFTPQNLTTYGTIN